jgi:glycosyltransferase involved in cell wall biosynthesis
MTRVMVVGSGWHMTSGISHYTYRLAGALAGRHQVSALLMRRLVPKLAYPGAGRAGADVTDAAYPDLVPVYDGVDWYWGRSMRGALGFIDRQRPDVVILQWWTGAVLHSYLRLASYAARRGARVIMEWHESQDVGEAGLPGTRRYVGALMPWLLAWSAAHVVHSDFDLRAITSAYPLGMAPVRVIRHGPYDHLAQPASPAPAGDSPAGDSPAGDSPAGDSPTGDSAAGDAPAVGSSAVGSSAVDSSAGGAEPLRLLYLGLVRPFKGVEDLVEAFSGLDRGQAERFRLTIVGETWEGWTAPAEAIARSPHADLIERVDRYVTDAELSGYFAVADAVVLPYHRSSASGPLQIAMSAGLPVVVTAVGGLIEAVRDYPGALLVPPRDPAALRGALLALPGLRGRRYADPHSWESTAEAFTSLMDDIRGGAAPAVARGSDHQYSQAGAR